MLLKHPLGTALLLLIVFALPCTAQSRTSPSSTSSSGSSTGQASGQAGRTRSAPCWQQAGVSQSVMEKRRQIEESTHSQVESVCGDSSLSQQQKQEKIRQLRQQGRKQMENLVTSQQMQAVESCRSQRRESRSEGGQAGAGGHRGGGSPCGQMSEGGTSRSSRSNTAGSEPDQQQP